MELRLVFLVISVSVLEIVYAVDYCDPSLCGSSKHIACNNNGRFAASCRNAVMLPLTKRDKSFIVRLHNNKRNYVASGRSKYNAACRMGSMQWDNELAAMAALNVKQCQMKHDACRNTPRFQHSGQNLAWGSCPNNPSVRKLFRQFNNLWYSEGRYANTTIIDKYPDNYIGPAIGHFTVMVGEANTRVGCAFSTYSVPGQPYKGCLLACNYATTNLIGAPMYKSCAVGASGCKTGKNRILPFLCSRAEVY
ncbi:antigen 5 like allergen Cul n 1 [Zeugodacus cucurbitae]|uniref:antigen 5 like allergen Cul n 1 n=1 Tax=Zeugodacus cucurbitae TaxID=28588 RepID=UPI000596A5C0|nr:antigen 5 like allergen Cul n 1 [Zeugodacus cucurbitae]